MTDLVVPRSTYAAQRHRSPGAMAAAIAFNGGVIALLLAMPAARFILPDEDTLVTTNIEATAPPPPHEDPVVEKRKPVEPSIRDTARTDEKPLVTDPVFPLKGVTTIDGGSTIDTTADTGTIGPRIEPIDPPHVPIFIQTRLDPRYAETFKPDYPLDMRRLNKEGSVTVRVMVNEKGRVVSVELVKASEPAFFEAAKRQALGNWRFIPATRDGKAVSSDLVLTLKFRLEDG